MVEQVRISPEEVRGYGNICEGHTLEDFIVSNSGLAKEKENMHGALTDVYKLVYSVYGLMFDFDKGNKQLYLQMAEADILSFGFDDEGKQLYLVDVDDTGFNLGFDEDTNELYITDDAPPVVHNYSLALDSESYTTTGSLSVSATLLDDGVAVEGATVSFTGGVSTVTATTNSSGVATATVTFSASGTLTASYSNVSDTATVTFTSYIINDDASADNSSTLFGNSITLRNSGTNTVAWNSSGYYTVTNTKSSSESMRALSGLDGVTDNFTIEYDAYLQASDGATGLVIYNSSTSFEGLLHDGGSFTYIYNDGSYHETNISSLSKSQQWVHFKFTVQGTSFTMECSQNNDVLYTTTQTIHLTPSSSTKYGFEVKWTYGRVTRYKNIQAYKI